MLHFLGLIHLHFTFKRSFSIGISERLICPHV